MQAKSTRKVTRGWSPARRRAQAERIRRTKPWLRSTGPKTQAGKDKAKMNALKHCLRSEAVRKLRRTMRAQRRFAAFAWQILKQDIRAKREIRRRKTRNGKARIDIAAQQAYYHFVT